MPKHKSVGGRKSVKTRKVFVPKAKPIYNSDEDVPDETADSFYKDDIDLHGEQLDQSSEDDNGDIPVAKAPSREAVYDFSDSEEEEELENRLKKIEANIRRKQKHSDSSESDLEEDDKIESRSKAWGKRRDDFYGADVSTKVDLGVSSGDEEAEARMEEEEARLQQQRLLSEIDESDYYLFMDKPEDAAVSPDNTELAEVSSSGAAVVIPTDLSTLSDKEKEALLKQKYPEFMDLMIDYRDTMIEYQKRVDPLIWAHDKGLLPDTDGIKLIRIKGDTMFNYFMCCQMYLILVAEKTNLDGHPVFDSLAKFKKQLNLIGEAESRMKPEIDEVLKKLAEGRYSEVRDMTHGRKKSASHVKVPAKDKETTSRKDSKKASAKTVKFKKTDVQPVAKAKEQNSKAVKSSSKSSASTLKNGVTALKNGATALKNSTTMSKSVTGKRGAGILPNKKKRLQSLLDDEEEEVGGATMEETVEPDLEDMTGGEKEALEFYNLVKKRRLAGQAEDDGEMDTEMEALQGEANKAEEEWDSEKRGVTEEMMKNRGLTAKRPKHLKNPRVKNKLKYQRKKKIHKSMVPKVLTEMNRYSGESSGIRAGRIRSVQLS